MVACLEHLQISGNATYESSLLSIVIYAVSRPMIPVKCGIPYILLNFSTPNYLAPIIHWTNKSRIEKNLVFYISFLFLVLLLQQIFCN